MIEWLIHGGEVIDGGGAKRRRADVAVDAGRIVAIGAPGEFSSTPARHTLDAEGLVVAPGFIDSHTHDDRLLLDGAVPRGRHPKLLQGVTTVVTGNCGVSLAPLDVAHAPPPLDLMGADRFRFAHFADYLAALKAERPATNAAPLVGHTTLRVATMAELDRRATADEIARMRSALAESLEAGAIGMSTGVYYPPARAATTEELIEVGRPLADGRGIVTMHIRDEGDAIDEALREALAVGRALNTPLVLSHHKLMGRTNHGRSRQTLALIEQAAAGQSVCLDCYPYSASSTMLLPARIGLASDVRITWSAVEPGVAGRSLMALAAERGIDPARLAEQLQPGGAIYFAMSDADVERILMHPLAMIGSDGLPHDVHPHPRLWGSFPRVLGHYARERRLFALETAVHKMTGLPAQRFGLAMRGMLQPGFAADITLFDPATIASGADFDRPTEAPRGIAAVFVNGRLAVRDGEVLDDHAGEVLQRRG